MAFDSLALAASLDELSGLVGSTITKIYTTERSGEVVLSTRGRGSEDHILVSTRREDSRIQVTRRHFEHPDHPGSFCMNLRKNILRSRIEGFEQVGLDRIARIHLSAKDELGHPYPLILIAETMGRNSNVILVDPGDGDRILTAMRFASADRNAHRSVLPGHPYRLPPQRDNLHPVEVDADDIGEAMDPKTPAWLSLVRRVDGPGPATLRRMLASLGMHPNDPLPDSRDDRQRIAEAYRNLGSILEERTWAPWVQVEAPQPPSKMPRPGDFGVIARDMPEGAAGVRRVPQPSHALDIHHSLSDSIERFEAMYRELKRALEAAHGAVLRRREKQGQDLARTDSAEDMQLFGELLTAYMHMVPHGARSVELPNYYEGGAPQEIPLDSRRSPAENAARYFKEYRRLQRTEKKARRQIITTDREISYIEGLLYQLSRAGNIATLRDLRTEVAEAGYSKEQAPPRRERRPSPQPIERVLPSGHVVLVGRNNRGNDHLTMRVAGPDDLWFHVKDMPGSHVVLPGPWRDGMPEESVLEEAARVAAYHSSARDSANVPVDYTLVKHVSKPRGAHPGMVIYRNQKTLFVTPDR